MSNRVTPMDELAFRSAGPGKFQQYIELTQEEMDTLINAGGPFNMGVEYNVDGVVYRSYDGKTLTPAIARIPTDIIGPSEFPYTLQKEDCGRVLFLNSPTDVTVIIPMGLGDGFNCGFITKGAGTISYSPSGPALNSANGNRKSGGQYTGQSLVAESADVLYLTGTLTA